MAPFERSGAVGVVLDDTRLEHFLAGNNHALGDGADVFDDGHCLLSIAAAPVSTPSASDGQAKPKNAAEAAKQFEALMIAQMLRTGMNRAGVPSTREDNSSSADTMFDVAGQQFAQVLANNGGLGLARMITQGLEKK